MRKYIKILLIAAIGSLHLQAQPKHEIRAVWLTSLYSLDWPATQATSSTSVRRQQKELCDILDELQKSNINTILFQTRLRADVIYPSSIEPFNECLTGKAGKNPGYDPLKFAIDECHKRNMEIHAWMVAIPLGKTKQLKSHGQRSILKTQPELCRQFRGHWYLDPGHPGTKEYLTRLSMEIVNNYDIDGIHLDYIRYPERSADFPDQSSYRKYGHGKDKAEWRRNNITAIVRQLYGHIKSRKPWVKVSCSPVGKYDDTPRYSSKGWNALKTVHQDVQLWLGEGIIDVIFPMMYFRDNDFFPFALNWNENKHGRFVVPGLGIYFLSPNEGNWKQSDITKQIYFIRNNHLEGQAFFRNKFFANDVKDIKSATVRNFYTCPAFVPAMTWSDSIPPSAPVARSMTRDANGVTLQWEKATNNDGTAVAYRIYASNSYPVDTDNPQNIVCNGTASTTHTVSSSCPQHDRLYWKVTAADRYGNESQASEFNRPHTPWYNIYRTDNINIPQGRTVIISTLSGQEIQRSDHFRRELLHKLPKGIYRISITNGGTGTTEAGILVN